MKEIWNTIRKRLNGEQKYVYKFSLITTIVFFLVTHGFAVFNLMPQHDSINHLIGPFSDDLWLVRIRRFLTPFFGNLKGGLDSPVLTAAFSIIWISLSVYLISDMFNLRKNYHIIILSGSFVANIVVLEAFSTFSYLLDIWFLSMFLSVLGANILVKKDSWIASCLTSILFCTSLGIYQAEIIVGFLLLITQIILDCLENITFKKHLKKWLKWGCCLCLSAVEYLFGGKVFQMLYHTTDADSYNSIGNIKQLFNIEILFETIKEPIANFFKFYYKTGELGNMFGKVSVICNIILSVIVLFVLIMHVVSFKKERIKGSGRFSFINIIIMLICFIGIPPIVMSMSIMMMEKEPRYYTTSGLIMFYPILLIILEKTLIKRKSLKELFINIFILLVGICIIKVSIFCNNTYSYQKIVYDRALVVTTQVEYELSHLEDYTPGETEVVVIGRFGGNPYMSNIDTDYYKYSFQAFQKTSFTYGQTFKSFCRNVGYQINTVTEGGEIYNEYRNMNDVEDMPVFPMKGSIRMINGRAVVKFTY